MVLFGPHADVVAQSAEMQAQLRGVAAQGVRWTLLPVASDQNWGAASTQLVHALMDEHALAILALDRDAAHLAEQLGAEGVCAGGCVKRGQDVDFNECAVDLSAAGDDDACALRLRLIEMAAEKSGANPEKLRDVLASGQSIDGVAFLSTGEPKVE